MSTAGLITEILVEEGQQVEADQILVRLKGREELKSAIEAAEFELSSAQKALDDLEEAAENAAVSALQSIPVYARQVRDAQYQLDNYTVPTEQEEMDPFEALDLMKERLDEARAAFDEVKERSSNDSTRRARKEDLDGAQSDYNSAVRRLEYVIELEAAEKNLENARSDYELYKDGSDPADKKIAQARIENAQAALEAAQAAFDDLELRAVISGTVSDLYVDIGEWVSPGQPILQIADLAHLRIETTDLNEIDAARVALNSEVTITFDAFQDQVQGTVASIAPKASEGSGVNYTVVIELEEIPQALLWGMTAFVDIEVSDQ
jgi:HlyD family secretion protein